jgi:hypothetical protein
MRVEDEIGEKKNGKREKRGVRCGGCKVIRR